MDFASGTYRSIRTNERLLMILRASARNDGPELHRLYQTAPRMTLRGPEPRLLHAVQAVITVNSWVVGEMRERFGILRGVAAASVAAEAVVNQVVRHGVAAQMDLIGFLGTPPREPCDRAASLDLAEEKPLQMRELMSPLVTAVVAEVVGLHNALAEFSETMLGLPVDVLLDATHPETNIELQAAVFAAIDPDPETLRVASAQINSMWAALVK